MRTVLVTGSSSGIGQAISRRLLDEGHRVVGVARRREQLAEAPAHFRPYSIDLADLGGLTASIQQIALENPELDAVVLSAGKGLFGNIEQLSPAQIQRCMDLNFTSHALIARLLVPLLKKKQRGDLIFIGSEAARRGRRMGSLYCAAKFALRGFAQALREECTSAGVRVSLINPGMVQTPFFDSLAFSPGEEPENYLLPEDVAATVGFLLAAPARAVVDEINLSPLKPVVRFRPARR